MGRIVDEFDVALTQSMWEDYITSHATLGGNLNIDAMPNTVASPTRGEGTVVAVEGNTISPNLDLNILPVNGDYGETSPIDISGSTTSVVDISGTTISTMDMDKSTVSTVYVNSAWDGKSNGTVVALQGGTAVIGLDAFATGNAAVSAFGGITGDREIAFLSDGSLASFGTFGTITLDANFCVTCSCAIPDEVMIRIDGSNFADSTKKVLVAQGGFHEETVYDITVDGDFGYQFMDDGKTLLVTSDLITDTFADADWTAEDVEGKFLGDKVLVWGGNAFASFENAAAKVGATGALYITGGTAGAANVILPANQTNDVWIMANTAGTACAGSLGGNGGALHVDTDFTVGSISGFSFVDINGVSVTVGSMVQFPENGTLNFDVRNWTPDSGPMLNVMPTLGDNASLTVTVSATQGVGTYALADGASGVSGSISVIAVEDNSELCTVTVGGDAVASGERSYSLAVTDSQLLFTIAPSDITPPVAPDDITVGVTAFGQTVVSWPSDDLSAWVTGYDVQLTVGDEGTLIMNDVSGQGVELCNSPADSANVMVKPAQSPTWPEDGKDLGGAPPADGPQVVMAESNGFTDVMFGRPTGVWNANYRAGHVTLPGEKALLKGRNQIGDLYFGSDDASILLLTDDANGDVFFLDDIYSAFPEGMDAQARFAKIDAIQAGAGADVVDLTSQRYEYVGGGMTIRGGLGDDVIWANSGDNLLFGDAGNDRIVGASGNDVLVGGAGDDSMHGLGGDDIFVFGGDWGSDTVEQLATGKVTLWFADGDESKWDAASLTYAAGANSVKVSGVSDVTLKFGDDGSPQYQDLLAVGAFSDFSSDNIFTDKNKGMLV